MSADLDIEANRSSSKWTRSEIAVRVLWALATPLFRLSPRPIWGWRRALLRVFGARIGKEAHIYPSVRIVIPWNLEIGDYASVGDRVLLYALGPIVIGAKATVSHGAHLCAGTHDYTRADLPLVKASVRIGDGAWICADAFVGPGVSIGDYAILGARGVAVGDVPAWTIVAGNPASFVRERRPPSAK